MNKNKTIWKIFPTSAPYRLYFVFEVRMNSSNFYQSADSRCLCTKVLADSGGMGMVAPNSGGVSRPALTGRNQSIKTSVQKYPIFTTCHTISRHIR